MKRFVLIVGLFGLASVASAQERRPAAGTFFPTRERTAVVTTGPGANSIYFFKTRRGVMGITVSIEPEASDSLGALVDAVTPSGPASKAGIRSGDIITSFNGTSLVSQARETRKLSPGLALVEASARLDAGDTARVELRRGRDRKTVSLVLETGPEQLSRIGGTPFETQMDADQMWQPQGMSPTGVLTGEGDGTFIYRSRNTLDFELAPMNQGLGQYFGVSEGVLVVSVPDDSQLNLKAGDVITSVDGRRVSNPNQFFRILRSYDQDETLRIDLVRMKRRETVSGRLGSR